MFGVIPSRKTLCVFIFIWTDFCQLQNLRSHLLKKLTSDNFGKWSFEAQFNTSSANVTKWSNT